MIPGIVLDTQSDMTTGQTVILGVAMIIAVCVFMYIVFNWNRVRSHFEPQSGFKVVDAFISWRGNYIIKVRDYVAHDSYDFNFGSTRPNDARVIEVVTEERAKNQKEMDDAESFEAQFKGRVFPN